jgi:hypothetical protein
MANSGRFERCRTVVTVAKIITTQKIPVSAEKIKRESMTLRLAALNTHGVLLQA